MAPPTPTSVSLYNGKYFDHLAPDPEVIDLDVLERGLQTPRFNNQTTRPITTAEHSLRVARIAEALDPGTWSISGAPRLAGLLHDAHEALVPWGDCLSPGKTDEMREIEADVDRAVWRGLGLDWMPSEGLVEVVKIADMIALYFEAMWWHPLGDDWAPAIRKRLEAEASEGYALASTWERFLPLIAPRTGESWRAEVEALIGS